MNISNYEYLSILQSEDESKSDFEYALVLEKVRALIAQNHWQDLADAINDVEKMDILKKYILQYTLENLAGAAFELNVLVEKIYLDMAGLGILTKYLQDPLVEEINLNGYKTVEIIYSDHTEFLYDEDAFSSAESALDVVKKMVRMGGLILDAQSPRVDSYIGEGTRISAMIPPAVPKELGVMASIRKQNKSSITKEQLIDSGAATADILDFLTLCLCNGISVGLAGGTGSGKTTDQAFLLNQYIRNNDDHNNRVYIIEDSRELNLIEYDFLHERPARVLYSTTKSEPNPITMLDLIISSLRYHPKLIVPAEVRDAAAYEAASAGQTGHTILTAFHADNAQEAYVRLVSMCHLAKTGLSDERLLEICVAAWPIMVYKKQLKDNSRKFMEVFEATGVKDGKLEGTMLYQFEISQNIRNVQGQICNIVGEHKQVGTISDKLYRRLKDNGADEETLQKLFPKLKNEVGDDHGNR